MRSLLFFAMMIPSPDASQAAAPAPPDMATLISVELGVPVEVAAMAGLDAAAYGGMLAKIAGAGEELAGLAELRGQADQLARKATALADAAAAGDVEARAQWMEAAGDLAASLSAIEGTLDALFAKASEGLPAQVVSALAAGRGAATRRVEPAFRAVSREPAEWDAIEMALWAERAARTGTEIAAEPAALLAAVRLEPAVVSAEVALAANLGPLQAAVAPPD